MNQGRALFLYSNATGRGKVFRDIAKIKARLSLCFEEFVSHQTSSMEEGMELARKACGKYQYLIIAGGDGTMNHIVNVLAKEENPPILGYINAGTICDIGSDFGIHGHYHRALKIIEEGYTKPFDVGIINHQYFFGYVAAIGSFADIPYITPRAYKKRIGRIAYYAVAAKEALFTFKKIPVHVEVDGKHYDLNVPFVLLLSGKKVGGFVVNTSDHRNDDGRMELFLTKPGLFNGLVHYLFFKTRTVKLRGSHFKITLDYPYPWCIDGEAGPSGSVEIEVLPRKLTMFCAKKIANNRK